MPFISNAYAATGSIIPDTGFNIMQFLPMIIIFILFWFLLIRPQQKKAKALRQMISQLNSGDEVVTNSGILGKISAINDQFVFLEVANNVVITVQKSTINGKVEKGTLDKAK
ncbi:MAG: preprotein translocase subunit YajC [Burkholderiales bacterium]|nr:preprotein translocase subunit YajC [Burkholderiales bacterium]